ncbi:hypothetical protein KJ644_00830 [Candidatus Dependentiae bacterium]|nr:hypothetical protein [Candidatus Dependentiae bacterium]MBU4386997.1 hypothetical protein [Candidatus Dependentiae bacterium]MCG2756675.1 hypothetical protein [Candidatus Dependentiae bacterium]
MLKKIFFLSMTISTLSQSNLFAWQKDKKSLYSLFKHTIEKGHKHSIRWNKEDYLKKINKLFKKMNENKKEDENFDYDNMIKILKLCDSDPGKRYFR